MTETETVAGAQQAPAPIPPAELQIPTLEPVNVCNTANTARTEWVHLGLPPTIAEFAAANGLQLELRAPSGELVAPCWPGVRLPDVAFYAAQLTMPPNTDQMTLQLRLVPDSTLAPLSYTAHPFVVDDLEKLQLYVLITDENGAVHPARASVQFVEGFAWRATFGVHAKIEGTPLTLEGYAYCDHMQPQVRLVLNVGMANVPAWSGQCSYRVRSIDLKCGEYLHVEHANAIGCGPQVRDAVGLYTTRLSGPRDLGRAERLPYRGWLLCLPSKPGVPNVPPTWEPTFRAIAAGGIMRATFTGWDGHYSSLGVVPAMPRTWTPSLARSIADQLHARHVMAMASRGDMYDQRPLGQAKYAGQTGDQDDFAAGQDVLALRVADPRRQDALLHSCDGWWLRPCHNRDEQGFPMQFAAHPGMRTWSQTPEVRVGSSDQFGWPDSLPWSWGRSGYLGIDDQHRSQELLTCMMHLDPCNSWQDLLHGMLQVDLAQAKVWQGSIDSPRAEGRLASAWADMLGLLRFQTDAKQLIVHAARRMDLQWQLGAGTRLPAGGSSVRALSIGTSPDLQNHATPCVVVWEHVLAAIGFLSMALRTDRMLADEEVQQWLQVEQLRHARELARNLLVCCLELSTHWGSVVESDGTFSPVLAFRWQEGGAPLPASSFEPGSRDVVLGGRDWWKWCMPALLIADSSDMLPAAIKLRVQAFMQTQPQDDSWAEWLAVCPPVEAR